MRRPGIPWRVALLALGAVVLTAVTAVAAVAAVALTATAVRPVTPGASSCPLHDRSMPVSGRQGSAQTLVPGQPRKLLVCRYSGVRSRALVSSALVKSARSVGRLAGELNHLQRASGSYNCPSDDGEALIARFGYASGGSNPVSVELSGCEMASNGRVAALAAGKPVLRQLTNLVPLPATITGHVQVCRGAGAGNCHTQTYTSCTASGCVTTDRVAAVDRTSGRQVAVAQIHRARFTMLLPPGRYTVELLGDGPRTRGEVEERVALTARSGFRVSATFTVDLP